MMRRLALGLAVLAAVVAWKPAQAGDLDEFLHLSGQLRIVGSEAGLAAVRQLAANVMSANPTISVLVETCGTGVGTRLVSENAADLSLADRDMHDDVLAEDGLFQKPYALDPVAVVVNPGNPVEALTSAQAAALLAGRYKTWAGVGGPPEPLLPVFLEASPWLDKPWTVAGVMSVSTQPAMKSVVARNRHLAGYVSLRDLDASLKPLALDGAPPTMEAFLAGHYPVFRTLRLIARKEHSPLVKAFINYTCGAAGQAVVEQAGYAPLRLDPRRKSSLPMDAPDLLAEGRE